MSPALLRTAVALVVACAAGQAARAGEDPVGNWRLRCVPPDGKARECVVVVNRQGDLLTGTYISDGVSKPVKGVAFDGAVLRIRVDGTFAGQTYGLTYTGKPEGNTLRGTARWSYGWASGTFPFDGRKVTTSLAEK